MSFRFSSVWLLAQLTLCAADYTVSTAGTDFTRGAALQAAINAADCGDRVIVPAGYTWMASPDALSSTFTLPNKATANCATGTLWLDIQSDQLASLPAGVRV